MAARLCGLGFSSHLLDAAKQMFVHLEKANLVFGVLIYSLILLP